MSADNNSLVQPFYTSLQRRLHWLVLLLLCVQFGLQWQMHAALDAIERQETLSFGQFLVTTLHTWGGISIAAIMVWRWQLRRRRVPPAGGSMPAWREKLVLAHHVSLYVVILFMALTGALHYYLGWQVPALWHHRAKWLLLVLIGVHIAGALSHIGDGNTVLHRMMGRGSLR